MKISILVVVLLGLFGCNATNTVTNKNVDQTPKLNAAECLSDIAKVAAEFERAQFSHILSNYFTVNTDNTYTPIEMLIKTKRKVLRPSEDGTSSQVIVVEMDLSVPLITLTPFSLMYITKANCDDGSVHINTESAPWPMGLTELINALELQIGSNE